MHKGTKARRCYRWWGGNFQQSIAMLNRDNFSKRIVTSLAGRVAYLCSNPYCRKVTIGPDSIRDKTTIIGEAAHITAAAPGGPRYDSTLTDIQRKDIDNGIWLCSNCSDLIDKNYKAFTIDTLKMWRSDAERYAATQISSIPPKTHSSRPKIEAILLWQRGMSSNEGLIDRPGPDGIINIEEARFFFKNIRTYNLHLTNNSSVTAINVNVKQIGGIELHLQNTIPLVNNIKPFKEKFIECKLITSYIMMGPERAANEAIETGYPTDLSEVQLSIDYKDEYGQEFQTLTSFTGKQPNNIFK
jgi:hypothetical protein